MLFSTGSSSKASHSSWLQEELTQLLRRWQRLRYSSCWLAVAASGSQGSVTVAGCCCCDLSRGSAGRRCQSGHLALGRMRAGSPNRWEDEVASPRGQPARSWGFDKPPKRLGKKGTRGSQLVSQRDSLGNETSGVRVRVPRCTSRGFSDLSDGASTGTGPVAPNSLHDVDRATAATSTAQVGAQCHVRPFVLRCNTAVFTSP